jgi:RNA 2',3'-cyclic 3'-phosphodiesterase
MDGQETGSTQAGPEVVRTFIAIELDRVVLKALDKLQAELKREAPDRAVRWAASDGIHLTLKFLGDVPSAQIPAIKAWLERACQPYRPFDLTCSDLGCFPNTQRPRVVWVGVREPGGILSALQQAVEREIAPLGYPTEDRGFTPHLTLGRAQRAASTADLRRLGDLIASRSIGEIARMEVRSISLMRSELRSTGAVYTCLADVALGARR